MTLPVPQPTGPGNVNVNNGNPTIPAGAVVNTGGATIPGISDQPQATYSRLPPQPQDSTDADPSLAGNVPDPSVLKAEIPNNTDPTEVGDNTAATEESSLVSGMQGAVDQINANAAKTIASYNNGQGNVDQGKALAGSALAGLAGSTAASGKSAVATGDTNKANAVTQINAENQIAGIYDSTNKAINDIKTATDATDLATKTAQGAAVASNVIRNLGSALNGASFDQMKAADPQFYQNLLNLVGGNESALELAYNSALPTPIKYDFTSIPGYALYQDPTTGQPQAISLGISPSADETLTVTSDGTPILFNKTTGQVSIAPGFSRGELGKDTYTVVKGTTTTDALGNQTTTPDRIFDSTEGQFVNSDGTVATDQSNPPTGSGNGNSGAGVGTTSPTNSPIPQTSGSGSTGASTSTTPTVSSDGTVTGTGANKLSFNQYGLLANTDFNPNASVDQLAQKYLSSYLNDGSVPTYTSLGRGITPTGFAQITARAQALYYQATGSELPSPQIIKGYQANIISNNKLANNLQIQTQTVGENVDLSLANMKANDLNSTGFQPLDSLIDTVQSMFQDPNVGQLLAQNATVQNELGSLLAVKNAAGTTVFDKLVSAGIISSSDSQAQVTQKVNALLKEASNFANSISSANATAYAQTDPLMQDPNNPARAQYMQQASNQASGLAPEFSAIQSYYQGGQFNIPNMPDVKTREDVISALEKGYPNMKPSDIEAAVYAQFPDQTQ